MAVAAKHNIVKMNSTTTGTGTLTLTTAVAGCLTFDLGGVANGETLTFLIRDGANSEVSRGVYTASGTTLTRVTVLASTNGGSKISCSGSETVSIVMPAEDMDAFAVGSSNYAETTIANNATGQLTLDTEIYDDYGLISFTTDEMVVARPGIYDVYLIVDIKVNNGSAVSADGWIEIQLSNSGSSDNTFTIHPTSSGNVIDYHNFISGGTCIMDASDTWLVNVVNKTGHSLVAYVQELRVKRIGATA